MKWFLIFLLLPIFTFAQGTKEIFLESILARVGDEPVYYSDLIRYRGLEGILQCAGVRVKPPGAGSITVRRTLGQYLEEELIYLEARSRASLAPNLSADTLKKIKSFPVCANRWKSFSQRLGDLWKANGKNPSGEAVLNQELEKRLLVDGYLKEKLGSDIRSWLQEARTRIPVKVYID